MARPQDPRITESVLEAALALLAQQSFAEVSMEAIAARAGVGKPALYRRFESKAELVATAISRLLPDLPDPDPQEPAGVRAALQRLHEASVPPDPGAYAGLIGGLMAEHRRHPQLIATFRERVLGPRRATVRRAVEAGQRHGVIRAGLDPELAVDAFGGPFMARAFAGLEMDERWRAELFDRWWAAVAA